MDLVPQVLGSFGSSLRITDEDTDLSGLAELNLTDDRVARDIWNRSPYAVVYDFIHTRVTLDYGCDPEIGVGDPFTLKLVFWNLLPEPRHLNLKWHLPEGCRLLDSHKNHVYLKHQDVFGQEAYEMTVGLIADEIPTGTMRGVLEVVAEGRPTVGLIPLTFFGKGA